MACVGLSRPHRGADGAKGAVRQCTEVGRQARRVCGQNMAMGARSTRTTRMRPSSPPCCWRKQRTDLKRCSLRRFRPFGAPFRRYKGVTHVLQTPDSRIVWLRILLGVLALGSLPAAASAYKTASQTGGKQAAQCRTAVTGDATVTTKTASDCSWLPPSDIDRGGCPSSWGVAVIKVGSASIVIRPGSPPMRLPTGQHGGSVAHGGLPALRNACSARPGWSSRRRLDHDQVREHGQCKRNSVPFVGESNPHRPGSLRGWDHRREIARVTWPRVVLP